jgi:hypothetical protein
MNFLTAITVPQKLQGVKIFLGYNYRIMLRWLAILAVIFAVAQAPMPATGQAPDKPAHGPAKKQDDANNSKKPLLPSRAVIKPNAAAPAPETDSSEQHGENQQNAVSIVETPAVPVVWSLHEKIAWGVNLALAGFAAFGICIAIKTLKTVRRQTEAAMIAARASFRQAKHIVTSERAWVIVSTSFPHGIEDGRQSTVLRVNWAMKNVGKTPARLLEFDAAALRADLGAVFPDPPHYYDSPRQLNRLLLVPNDSFGLTWMIEGDALTPEEVKEVETGAKLMIISYGYIKYLDDFGDEHTTRFCQRYSVNSQTKEKGFLPYTEAPRSYTDSD